MEANRSEASQVSESGLKKPLIVQDLNNHWAPSLDDQGAGFKGYTGPRRMRPSTLTLDVDNGNNEQEEPPGHRQHPFKAIPSLPGQGDLAEPDLEDCRML